MKRVLLTGLSGTGKSTVVAELRGRGHRAVDLDCDEYSEWVEVDDDDGLAGSPVEPGRDWLWREERLRDLLARDESDVLFVSGCAPNMREFLPQFDEVVLLTAPPSVMTERIATRGAGQYGKRPSELARAVELVATVEPLLRRVATHELDTAKPLGDVVDCILELTQP